MKVFFLISNPEKDPDLLYAAQIRALIESKGGICRISDSKPPKDGISRFTDPASIPEDTEIVLVLGGDGTLIAAARDLVSRRIPMIGINRGTLGYLTELEYDRLPEAIDNLIADRYHTEERMMLTGELIRGGQVLMKNAALNEIVLARGGDRMALVRFDVSVNGRFLSHYAADGVIFSTPTGSTAYNLSAGGPILEPTSRMILMTPVSPHSLFHRSIVFGSDAIMEIELVKCYGDGALVAFDGSGECMTMIPGDRLRIAVSEQTTKIATLNRESFLETLRNRMEGA